MDLHKITNFINKSQVKRVGTGGLGADKVGGFTNFPNHFNSVLEPKDFYYDMVQFEAAYYAIQTLNLIIEVIGGSYSGYGIDVNDLADYIFHRMIYCGLILIDIFVSLEKDLM